MARSVNPFARAREDHTRETAEDYVELIHELGEGGGVPRTADLVRRLGIAQPTVTKTLARLERDGFVAIEPRRGVRLTEAGARMARESRARHETILAFLLRLGVGEEQAALDAEGIEHHLSAETVAAIESWLGQVPA